MVEGGDMDWRRKHEFVVEVQGTPGNAVVNIVISGGEIVQRQSLTGETKKQACKEILKLKANEKYAEKFLSSGALERKLDTPEDITTFLGSNEIIL